MPHGALVNSREPKKAKQVTGEKKKLQKLKELKTVKKEIKKFFKADDRRFKAQDKLFTKERKLKEQLGIE